MKPGDLVRRMLFSSPDLPERDVEQVGVVLGYYEENERVMEDYCEVLWSTCSAREGAIESDYISTMEVISETR